MGLQKKIELVISWSRFDDLRGPLFYYNGLLKMTELNIFHNGSNILYMVSTETGVEGGEERRREGRETDRGRGRKRRRERKREGGRKGGV